MSDVRADLPDEEYDPFAVFDESTGAKFCGEEFVIRELQHTLGQVPISAFLAPRKQLTDERQRITEVPTVKQTQ